MKEKDNYKPRRNYWTASSNIRYCKNCGKYQHFIRNNRKNKVNNFDRCIVCGFKEDVDDLV